jgi:hypothetical protein
MLDVDRALAGAARQPPRAAPARRRALVAGGGGALGSAVLETLLGTRCFERVGVLVEQPIQSALRGFVPVDAAGLGAFGADTALIVFDRARSVHGREAAFVRPDPRALPALAQGLQDSGTRHLLVVVPHTPSLLPMALQRGLASLDEAAVAALGFEHLVFMRMAQTMATRPLLGALRRLARWMLSQLHFMVPLREQPVRVETVARLAAALAVALPRAVSGTRVVPAELLWQAAQLGEVQTLAGEWLQPQRGE